MVESLLPKQVVVGSNPIARSKNQSTCSRFESTTEGFEGSVLPSWGNTRGYATRGITSVRSADAGEIVSRPEQAPSVGAGRQVSGPTRRRSVVQIPSPAPNKSFPTTSLFHYCWRRSKPFSRPFVRPRAYGWLFERSLSLVAAGETPSVVFDPLVCSGRKIFITAPGDRIVLH